jgi:DNA repair protein RadA/Sms
MPATNKTIFTCEKCDAQFPKWSGRCLSCGAWGTLKESTFNKNIAEKPADIKFDQRKLKDFKEVATENFDRLKTNIPELDQIFGGGIVKGSLILIGGEPGIGKSTLVLQILKQLEGGSDSPLLYVSGEESAGQIKIRIDRLGYKPQNLKFLDETSVEEIASAIRQLRPKIAVIDSIQTIHSGEIAAETGNVAQIRACTVKLLEAAKSTNVPLIIIGHVTKDGEVAGPKTLEHLVDVVLYLEGDKLHGFRILRGSKNRFGSTNEIGVFQMTGAGLEEVKDPGKAFLAETSRNYPGSALTCFVDGTRPFLAEVQALVIPTLFGFPQRKTSGYDINRLQMISAVLYKRANINLNAQDIHLNLAGGLKLNDPSIDMAVAAAIVSALRPRRRDAAGFTH